MTGRLALLGRDHSLFGAVTARGTGDGRAGLAISVGGDPGLTKWDTKGDVRVPNEDACCVVDTGSRVLLAVADSHYGHRASHRAVEWIAAADVPGTPEQLEQLVEALARLSPTEDESETTLAIAVLDRADGAGFGVSFGDSTVATVGPDGVEVWSVQASDYVIPGTEASFRDAGHRFRLAVPDGSLLIAYSDGVDACGGRTGPSIAAPDLAALSARVGPSADEFARELAESALRGVGDHPGGHDNVAVVAARR